MNSARAPGSYPPNHTGCSGAVALDGITADLAIRYGDGHWPGLVAEKLFDNTFIPACSPHLGLTRVEDLPNHPLIHFRPQQASVTPVDWAGWPKDGWCSPSVRN